MLPARRLPWKLAGSSGLNASGTKSSEVTSTQYSVRSTASTDEVSYAITTIRYDILLRVVGPASADEAGARLRGGSRADPQRGVRTRFPARDRRDRQGVRLFAVARPRGRQAPGGRGTRGLPAQRRGTGCAGGARALRGGD